MAGLKDKMLRKRVVKTTPSAHAMAMKRVVNSRWLGTDDGPFCREIAVGHRNYRGGVRGAREGSSGVDAEREPRGSIVGAFVACRRAEKRKQVPRLR